MCTRPVEQTRSPTNASDVSGSPPVPSNTSGPASPVEKPNGNGTDLEGAYNLENLDPVIASAEAASSMRALTFSRIINQIWHFCSVDYGPRCMLTSWHGEDLTDVRIQQILVSDIIPCTRSKLKVKRSIMAEGGRTGREYGAGSFCATTVWLTSTLRPRY